MLFTNRQAAAYGVLVSCLVIAACADVPTQPAELSPIGPAFAVSSGSSCASSGAVVVSTEAQLRAAVAAAQSGDVVAISGMITLTGTDDGIEIPEGVTVTCAAPGAGVGTNTYRYAFFIAYAPNVTVSGLVLDGFHTEWPMLIQNGVGRTDVADVTFNGNTVTCGWSGCTFVVNAPRSVITNNVYEAKRNSSGVHIQGGLFRTDGTLVENNTITALVPSGLGNFGAVRPRDGTDIVLRGNTIRGPWSNGVATTVVLEGLFERNTIEGAWTGIFVNGARNSLYRGNDIASTVGPALRIQGGACANVFIANRLTSPAAAPTILFNVTSGANVVLGSPTTVQDLGNFDCDGDGINDPNSYKGSPHKGGYVGETMSEVMPRAGRVQMH